MTRLRFVGDLPLWLGLLLALLVALMAWRYYRRESFDLPHRLRWVLPALRSLAFFLGIMVFTGPVLHHRETIGELGRVRIYVDGSQSMGLLDRHVSPGRKLLIAEQQGWLEEGRVVMETVSFRKPVMLCLIMTLLSSVKWLLTCLPTTNISGFESSLRRAVAALFLLMVSGGE